MKKSLKKVTAITLICGCCMGVAGLQKEKEVRSEKAWAAATSYCKKLQPKNSNAAMAEGVAGVYVSTCVSCAATFCWGGPAGVVAGVLVGL